MQIKKSSLPQTVDPITKQLEMVQPGIKYYTNIHKDAGSYYKQIIGEYELQETIDEKNRLKFLEYENKNDVYPIPPLVNLID